VQHVSKVTRSLRSFMVVALCAAAFVAMSSSPTAAVDEPIGCGYGTGGPFADTLCWIDMSAYAGGTQEMSVNLPGGYTVSFTVSSSGTRSIVPVAFPAWDFGAAIGKYIYLDTPGQPALYQTIGAGAGSSTIELSDIVVTDAADNPVHGWRMVGADAEATADSESITFSSDGPISTLATYAPPGSQNGCQMHIEQIDANTIECTGTNIGDAYGTALFSALEPTSFTQTMTVGNGVSREAVAFAFQTSTLAGELFVDGTRVSPNDSFGVSIVSPEGTTVATADTGAGDFASTGSQIVLPRVDGSAYTLQVTTGPGTSAASYFAGWACTPDGEATPTVTQTGYTVTVTPDPGVALICTARVTATGPGGGGPAAPVPASPRFTG
jgi:hypothetical protein